MKCMECMVLFNFIYEVFVQNFYWNIGETEVEIQIEVQEIVGPRWALLGFGRTHGSADPRVALLAMSLLCMILVSVVCYARYGLPPPHWTFACNLIQKHMETKQNSTSLKNGELIFYWIIKYGGTLQLKGNTWKKRLKSKVVTCPRITVKGDVQSNSCPSQHASPGILS